MAQHIKPFYINAHFYGKLVSRMMIDNRTMVNILPTSMLSKLKKDYQNLIPTKVTMSNFVGGMTKTA